MIGFVRLAVFGFLFLAVMYLLISIYSRSLRREKLEKYWDAEVQEGDRDTYIQDGMADYERSLRKKLILLVFVVPVLLVMGIIYMVNFQ